jgi:hypothetical protein
MVQPRAGASGLKGENNQINQVCDVLFLGAGAGGGMREERASTDIPRGTLL